MKNLLILIIFTSCATRKNIPIKNDYNILKTVINNDILNNKKRAIIYNNKNYYFKKPSFYLNLYKRHNHFYLENNPMSELDGEVKWIFSESDIDNMQDKYIEWKKSKWKNIITTENVVLFKGQLSKEYEEAIYLISHPLFDKTKKKALVVVKERKNINHTFSRLFILKKINNEWYIVGKLFINLF